MAHIVTIPKNITHGDELVIVRRDEFEALKKHLAEVIEALSKIRKGEWELKRGKTRIVKSLSELRYIGYYFDLLGPNRPRAV